MGRRLLFLDWDGVMNHGTFIRWAHENEQFWKDHPDWRIDPCDPVCMERLNRICRLTGAELVVSATLRLAFQTKDDAVSFMRSRGFEGPVIGATGRWFTTPNGLGEVPRGLEIQEYLDHVTGQQGEIEAIVILDDDDDMVHLSERLVQLDSDLGLTEEKAEHAMEMLAKPWKAVRSPVPIREIPIPDGKWQTKYDAAMKIRFT